MANHRSAGVREEAYPKRGQIYLAAFDPSVGREIQKTRPALVVQNDVSNRVTEVTIVAPITSKVRLPVNPQHVLIAADSRTGLSVTSVAVFNQVRAVDRRRLLKLVGVVDTETMRHVDEAIKITFGLVRF